MPFEPGQSGNPAGKAKLHVFYCECCGEIQTIEQPAVSGARATTPLYAPHRLDTRSKLSSRAAKLPKPQASARGRFASDERGVAVFAFFATAGGSHRFGCLGLKVELRGLR
jgi:hypothetical protein